VPTWAGAHRGAGNVLPIAHRPTPSAIAVPATFQIAVLGFSSFERNALASYFRLAANRTPAYHQTSDLAQAHFLVVDGDQAVAVDTVTGSGRLRDALFIGAHAPVGAQSWMMRPLDPLHVLRELDTMVALGSSDSSPIPLSPEPAAAPSRDLRRDAAHSRRASDSDSVATRAGPNPLLAPSSADIDPVLPIADTGQPRALLVDDSELALHFLERHLKALGLVTQRAMTSGKALDLLSRQRFDFVFIDVELGERSEVDGLELCRRIKTRPPTPGGLAPVVIMLSAHSGQQDRARGQRAGCDGYLGKPLVPAELQALIARPGPTTVPASPRT
jgi:CheY-like chemotaxis protein